MLRIAGTGGRGSQLDRGPGGADGRRGLAVQLPRTVKEGTVYAPMGEVTIGVTGTGGRVVDEPCARRMGWVDRDVDELVASYCRGSCWSGGFRRRIDPLLPGAQTYTHGGPVPATGSSS
jgi:hypothetical protein